MKYTENKLTSMLRCILWGFVMTVFLSGCSDDGRRHELEQYVAQLKQMAQKKSQNKKPAVFELPKPVLYGRGVSAANNALGDNASPLQRFPLKSLQFIGTIANNHKISAYIMTPDSMVYPANVGDIIGDSYDKITKIDTDHIEILESSQSGSANAGRIVTLLLKE